ncbi:MAG: hypothetical protein J5694_01810 [Erysipelotrichaceae bacterium]|nr:hypothetical protein [Erysipelotrichaceae bacterium]
MEIGILCLNGKESLVPLMLETLGGKEHVIRIIGEEELSDLISRRAFDGVMIDGNAPQSLTACLDELSPLAEECGYVNVIVNRSGRLTGYNTAGYGFMKLLENSGIDVRDQKTAITPDVSIGNTLLRTIRDLGGSAVTVSPEEELNGCCFNILVNAQADCPADLKKMPDVKTVIDICCPPLRSQLVYDAQISGKKAVGGFEMKLAESAAALELISGEEIGKKLIDDCRRRVYRKKRNIVIIGMPTAGKSTISELVRSRYGRTIVEMDDLIVEETGMSISDYFAVYGEQAFRERESGICEKLSEGSGLIVSTGGGVVKRRENMLHLAANSLIIWLDRDLSLLQQRDDRPLSGSRKALEELFAQRRELYEKYSDIRIENNMTLEDVMKVLEDIL